MNHSIYIFDRERLKLPRPYTIAVVWNQLQKFGDEPAPVNPRHIELASKLIEEFPTREMLAERGEDERHSVWTDCPLKEARSITHAVWHMNLLRLDCLRVLPRIVRHATAVGLSLYDHQMVVGFLPDGTIIPESRAEIWEAFRKDAESGT